MEFKDITTWTVTADHKARPKNPVVLGTNYSITKEIQFNKFERDTKEHTYHCSPSLVAGEYPAADMELIWQYAKDTKPPYILWCNALKSDYLYFKTFAEFDKYYKTELAYKFETRQYLQLKQPMETEVKNPTSNECNIEECIREYEANKLLKPFLIDADIFKEMSKHFHVAIKKDVNGYCISCHKEPCACHLIPTI